MEITHHRLASLVVAAVYFVAAAICDGGAGVLQCAIALVLPLGCIWFSDELGEYTGRAGHGMISNATPGPLVAVGGWALLLLPVIMLAIGPYVQLPPP